MTVACSKLVSGLNHVVALLEIGAKPLQSNGLSYRRSAAAADDLDSLTNGSQSSAVFELLACGLETGS